MVILKLPIIITQSLFCDQASKVIKFSNYYGNSNPQVKVAAQSSQPWIEFQIFFIYGRFGTWDELDNF